MKKISLSALGLLMLFMACKKSVQTEATEETLPETTQTAQRQCASMEVLEEHMKADPSLRQRMAEIESFTQRAIASGETQRLDANGNIIIPVVVNVLYNTVAEDISLDQINSQIAVLNEDFNNTNSDGGLTPAEFKTVQAAVGVRFELAKVVRKKTNKKSWGTNDAMKKSSMGGIDPTNPAENLNMWSCNLGQGLLGYAQFPGQNPATDGVVILYSAFGSRAKASGTYVANYDLGRTATHEVGHWLNLRHIWGDATCGNDFVGDTPVAQTSNGGCPNYPKVSACGGHAEMTMNYMDYTYDKCMYMFTTGQKNRMLAVMAAGGPRASLAD